LCQLFRRRSFVLCSLILFASRLKKRCTFLLQIRRACLFFTSRALHLFRQSLYSTSLLFHTTSLSSYFASLLFHTTFLSLHTTSLLSYFTSFSFHRHSTDVKKLKFYFQNIINYYITPIVSLNKLYQSNLFFCIYTKKYAVIWLCFTFLDFDTNENLKISNGSFSNSIGITDKIMFQFIY